MLGPRLSIPFAGSWGLRPILAEIFESGVSPFNPVCRELGAPPSCWFRVKFGSSFNPVCRELGAPPGNGATAPHTSRLSIPFAGSWGLRRRTSRASARFAPFNPVCRELGAPPHMSKFKIGDILSIPFAGSWGLRLLAGKCEARASHLSIPFAGSWGLRLRLPSP